MSASQRPSTHALSHQATNSRIARH